MEKGRFLPLLCLVLVGAVHLCAGCPPNEEPVMCSNECNTCAVQGECFDCSQPTCDCLPGHSRDDFTGLCIPTTQCAGSEEVLVQEDRGCPRNDLCNRSCRRSGRRGGRCGGRRRRFCRCY